MKKFFDFIYNGIIYLGAILVIVISFGIIVHIFGESLPAFFKLKFSMFDWNMEWRPVSKNAQFGLMPIIAGTVYVSFLALITAMVFGVGTAFFINFYIPKKISVPLLSFLELVSGIPSVIFGFVALSIFVKNIAIKLNLPSGHSVFAASMILSVMLLPFIVSSCNESINIARRKYEKLALSLALPKEEIAFNIILPSIKKGIVASAVMAFGRAIGETMAVMMVVGNSPIYPRLFKRAQTLASLTALEMGSIEYGSIHLSVLYVANSVLVLILFIVFYSAYRIKKGIEDE